VFDAGAVDAGPVASVTLPYGLPLGLHGQFVPAWPV
jgi:all-trans-8'-apo-beta-carotenal 15,15'-oxygenase